MSFVDINEQKRLQEEQRKIIDALRESVLVLDTDLKITSANQAFYRIFQISAAEVEGCHLSEISKDLDTAELRELARSARKTEARIEDLEIACRTRLSGGHKLRINGYRLHIASAPSQKVLLVMEELPEGGERPKKNAIRKGPPRKHVPE